MNLETKNDTSNGWTSRCFMNRDVVKTSSNQYYRFLIADAWHDTLRESTDRNVGAPAKKNEVANASYSCLSQSLLKELLFIFLPLLLIPLFLFLVSPSLQYWCRRACISS